MSEDDAIDLNAKISKRKLLGGLGLIGGGAVLGGGSTLALLSDTESFGSPSDPNIIQSGEIDLTVDWEVTYFGPGAPQTLAQQETPVDRPGPIVDVTDLKSGDIIEKTLSTHIETNPAFLTFDLSVLADEDNGINNPEDAVSGTFDGYDGTEGGDLAENLYCVVWYDGFEDSDGTAGGSGGTPGNNRPDEGIWTAEGDPTNDEDFEEGLESAQLPSDVFDTGSDLVIASGTLAELANTDEPILMDSRAQGDTPSTFGDSACYSNGSVQYIGCVCWLPRDIPGIDDNILQTDRLEYQFSLSAIQCRSNVADDGTPQSTAVATQPGGDSGETDPAFTQSTYSAKQGEVANIGIDTGTADTFEFQIGGRESGFFYDINEVDPGTHDEVTFEFDTAKVDGTGPILTVQESGVSLGSKQRRTVEAPLDPGTYELVLRDANSNTVDVASLTVQEGIDPAFKQSTYTVEQGQTAEIGVTTGTADTFQFQIGSRDSGFFYDINEVDPGTHDEVTFEFNTANVDGSDDIVTVNESGVSLGSKERQTVAPPLDSGTYQLVLRDSNASDVDISSLSVSET